jgi:preprotein translocase subunit YajC
METDMDFALLMAPRPQTGESPGLGGMLIQLLPILLIFVIFWLLVLRPHSRKQKELAQTIAGLKQGDRVLTAGGIYGTVVGDKDSGTVFVLKIAENVKIEVARSAISGVVKKAKEA